MRATPLRPARPLVHSAHSGLIAHRDSLQQQQPQFISSPNLAQQPQLMTAASLRPARPLLHSTRSGMIAHGDSLQKQQPQFISTPNLAQQLQLMRAATLRPARPLKISKIREQFFPIFLFSLSTSSKNLTLSIIRKKLHC